jgi:hypothetical protein
MLRDIPGIWVDAPEKSPKGKATLKYSALEVSIFLDRRIL